MILVILYDVDIDEDMATMLNILPKLFGDHEAPREGSHPALARGWQPRGGRLVSTNLLSKAT